MNTDTLAWPISGPFLEELNINFSVNRGTFLLPTTLTGGDFPRVNKLRVFQCYLEWENVSFMSTLSHLTIWNNSHHFKISAKDIVACLRFSPRLKTLSWKVISLDSSDVEHTASQALSNVPAIILPYLSTMEFELNDHVLAQVLSVISHPQDRLSISCALPTMARAKNLLRQITQFHCHMAQRGRHLNAMYIRQPLAATWIDAEFFDLSYQPPASPLELKLRNASAVVQAEVVEGLGPEIMAGVQTIMTASTPTFRLLIPHLAQCTSLCATTRAFYLEGYLFENLNALNTMPVLEKAIVHDMPISQAPKSSRQAQAFRIPRFVSGLKTLVGVVPYLVIVDCDIPESEDKKLQKLSKDFTTFLRVTTPKEEKEREESFGEVLQRLLAL